MLFFVVLFFNAASSENIFHIGYMYYTDEQFTQNELLTTYDEPSVLGRESESSGFTARLDYDFLTYFTVSLKYMHREFHLQTEDYRTASLYIEDLKRKGYSDDDRDLFKQAIPRTKPVQYKFYHPIQYHEKSGDTYYAGFTAKTPIDLTIKFSYQSSKGIISGSSADQSAANDRIYDDIEDAISRGLKTDAEDAPKPKSQSYTGSLSQAFFTGNTELEIGFSYVDSTPVFSIKRDFNTDIGQYYYYFDRTSAYQAGTYFILNQVLTKTTALQLTGVYATDPDLEDGRELSFRINQYIVPTKSSIHFTYRYFWDTFSLRSNLFEVLFYQYLTKNTIVKLRYRYYWEDNDSFDYDTLVSATLDPDDYSISESISPLEGRLYGVKLTQNLLAFFSEDSQIGKLLDRVELEISYHRMTIYDKRYDKYIDEAGIGYGGFLKNEGEMKIESDVVYAGLTFKY